MSEILRSKTLAMLTTILALGAAGCGASGSSSSPDRAKQAGPAPERSVGNPGNAANTTPAEANTTTASPSAPPQEASSGQINSKVNYCNTAVDELVRSRVSTSGISCVYSGTAEGQATQWIQPSSDPTKTTVAVVETITFPPSVPAQTYDESLRMDGGTPAGTIDGAQCIWRTSAITSTMECFEGATMIDVNLPNPPASLEFGLQATRLVMQAATQ